MRIRGFHMAGVRVVKDLQVSIAESASRTGLSFTAFIGPNGSGKTTILEWLASMFTSRPTGLGSVDFDIGTRTAVRPWQHGGDIYAPDAPGLPNARALFVRAVRDPKLQLGQPLKPGDPPGLHANVALNVSDDTSSDRLVAVHAWLMHLQLRGKRPRLWDAVAVLFPNLTFVEFDPANHDLVFEDRGNRVGFNALSAGQRAIITLFGEIERHCAPDGIVLWDEPEAHLQVGLQWRLREALAVILPEGQVIVATHSPNMIEGALPYEVVVLGDVEAA